MQAREKLAESAYFLRQLQASAGNDITFGYNLSAFLSATFSAVDIMLYDFAEIFGLGFTRDDYLTERDFEVASKAFKNQKALDFLEMWRKGRKSLSENPLGGARRFTIHRGSIELGRDFSVQVSGWTSYGPNVTLIASIASIVAMGQSP